MAYNIGGQIDIMIDIRYKDTPLTDEEFLLACRWNRDKSIMAGLMLLSLRMVEPRCSVDDLVNLDIRVTRGLLLGMAQSIAYHYNVQTHVAAFDRMTNIQGVRH